MKKVFLLSVVAAIFSLGFTSCKRCQECTRSSSPTIKVCEKDYNSNTEYSITLDVLEAGGYNCR